MTMECRYNWMVPGAGCGRYWRVEGGLTAALELPSPASSLTGPVQPPPAISTIPQPVLADAPAAHLQPPPVLHPHLVLVVSVVTLPSQTISFCPHKESFDNPHNLHLPKARSSKWRNKNVYINI